MASSSAPTTSASTPLLKDLRAPLAIFFLAAAVYVATLADRALTPSPDNHFVYLAESFLHGQLGVVGNVPPGDNDWARYGETWYVSFPPFPAVVILPAVAVWGKATLDRLFWAICAGLSPTLVYVLLRSLSRRKEDDPNASGRSTRDNLLLTFLYAFGSVYFYVAVQGTVWFAAHVVGTALLALYVLFSLDARRPVLAGLVLGLAFMTRATMMFAAPFFLLEVLRVCRLDRKELFSRLLRFALPILAIGAVAMWMNAARFDDPFEFGHRYLQIRWRGRIETWGLFNYHFVAKNLAVVTSALPWLSGAAPFLRIGRHGLALWVTTPNLLTAFWPKKRSSTLTALFFAAACVALVNLAYQNSGWVQFGYRFSLDYLVFLIVAIALGGRRFGVGFWLAAIVAVIVNAFGAITFDRMPQFYDDDASQERLFQPD